MTTAVFEKISEQAHKCLERAEKNLRRSSLNLNTSQAHPDSDSTHEYVGAAVSEWTIKQIDNALHNKPIDDHGITALLDLIEAYRLFDLYPDAWIQFTSGQCRIACLKALKHLEEILKRINKLRALAETTKEEGGDETCPQTKNAYLASGFLKQS